MASSIALNAVLGSQDTNILRVGGRWHQVIGATHILGRHISRKACDLQRIAILELLKRLRRSGDQDDVVGRHEQGLGHGKANAAACAGNDDCLFHLLTGNAERYRTLNLQLAPWQILV